MMFARLLSYGIAFVWAYAGTTKLVGVILGVDNDVASTWLYTFPIWLILMLGLAECLLAIFIFAGGQVTGMLGGSLMLLSFLAAYLLYPPAPDQSCGCLGSQLQLANVSVVGRLLIFIGLHIFTAALLWKPHSSDRHPQQGTAVV